MRRRCIFIKENGNRCNISLRTGWKYCAKHRVAGPAQSRGKPRNVKDDLLTSAFFGFLAGIIAGSILIYITDKTGATYGAFFVGFIVFILHQAYITRQKTKKHDSNKTGWLRTQKGRMLLAIIMIIIFIFVMIMAFLSILKVADENSTEVTNEVGTGISDEGATVGEDLSDNLRIAIENCEKAGGIPEVGFNAVSCNMDPVRKACEEQGKTFRLDTNTGEFVCD